MIHAGRAGITTRRLVAMAALPMLCFAPGAAAQAPANNVVATAIIGPSGEIESTPDPQKADTAAVIAHLEKKEYDEALRIASKLIERNPGDPFGYNLQGAVYVGKKDPANARRSFEKALAVERDYFPATMNLAQLDLDQNDAPSAQRRYQALLSKDPGNVAAMLGMARTEAVTGNDAENLKWIERARAKNPDSIAPRMELALRDLRQKNYPKAIGELTDALRSHPDNAELLELLGQAQLADGQKATAVATYRKLVSARPTSAVAYYRLATSQVGIEDYRAAAGNLQKALELKPDYEDAMEAYAALHVRAGRHDEALKLARKLQQIDTKSSAGYTLEGDVLMTQRRFPQAVAAYEKAMALGQTSILTIKLHAAQTAAAKPREADSTVQRWLNDHPDDIGVRQYLAHRYLNSGQNKLAIEQYERVLQKDPTNLLALNNLANLYQMVNDSRALETAEAAYRLDPNSSAIADTLGWLLVQQGQTARGLELLQKAIAQEPGNSFIRYHLAAALAKSGNKPKARKELESLLAGDPQFPQREAAQALLKQL